MEESIAQQIVILRTERQWTQAKLAEELGTTQKTVSTLESGKANPSTRMKVRLAKVFALDPTYFLETVEITKANNQKETQKTRIYR